MGWDGIGTFLGKISTFIPGRIEKLKNERERLTNEWKELKSKPYNDVNYKRGLVVNQRLQQIDSILRNNARD